MDYPGIEGVSSTAYEVSVFSIRIRIVHYACVEFVLDCNHMVSRSGIKG